MRTAAARWRSRAPKMDRVSRKPARALHIDEETARSKGRAPMCNLVSDPMSSYAVSEESLRRRDITTRRRRDPPSDFELGQHSEERP